MTDRVPNAAPLTAAPEAGQNPVARKTVQYTPSGGVMTETPKPAAASPSSDPAAKTLTAVPNSGAMPAESRFGDYAWLDSSDGSEPRSDSSYATRRPSWPQRCERALLHYLGAQDGRNAIRSLVRGRAEGIMGSGRSSANSADRRRPSTAA